MEPKSSRNGPRRALKDPKNHPRRRLEKLLAIMVDPEDSKKACWRPRIAQEGLLEAKISPRSRFGAIWGPFWGPVFAHVRFQNRVQTRVRFWSRFWLRFGPKK